MASDGPRADPADGRLRSVSIALAVLRCFATAPELGPSAVARELGVAKSTASRTLAVMADRGVLERCGGGRYRLGLLLFEYGQMALNRLRLYEVSVPVLGPLRDRVRELVQLGIPMGAEVLFLDRFEGHTLDPRFHGPEWRRLPAHSSSTGRAIAAFNPALADAVFAAGLRRRTRYTVVDPRRLAQILDEVRERGYAFTDEEAEEGFASVAAPVVVELGGRKRAIAAVSVVGPSSRMRRDRIASVAAHAREAARVIGVRLAASG
ncbi:MAG TPA: IclR family transcriptional regulator [Solirubrobacteraceae bacterium]|jgi:DNA-binding IclR family transcriptional regulator|nr:IclR family transcriptional regulator [Solirubrobacteraceae bacterium]